jgi:ribosomal protein S18 acetylase RimI-like enzyme
MSPTRDSNPAPPPLSFRKARAEDAERIAHLVNSAYRGDSSRAGWTTEAELIDGARTNPQEILGLIEGEGSLILLCLRGVDIVGSVYLQRRAAAAYLGLLVVNPQLQGAGIGKQLMAAAETLVRTEWGSTKMTMTVISVRQELIAFYERRGYRRIGESHPFPASIGASIPKVPGLQFEVLEKSLAG